MKPQEFKDMREGVLGFMSAFALAGALAAIFLGAVGYFDQGTKYRYPHATAKEHRR